ncbi:MAG: type II toxin-antitoxin system VapC family toxin [Phycisphaerae bacterium]|nr:type II toxin-antitoxin system VapC family toxin [Phycisphaerae bacterium]
MTVYIDTSALLKKYIQETGSDEVVRLWTSPQEMAISRVGYAEALAAFARRRREGTLTQDLFEAVVEQFKVDWKSLARLPVSDELDHFVDRLVRGHSLRGLDVIHLASALSISEGAVEDFLFVSADRRLLDAARREGLNVYPDRSW